MGGAFVLINQIALEILTLLAALTRTILLLDRHLTAGCIAQLLKPSEFGAGACGFSAGVRPANRLNNTLVSGGVAAPAIPC
jgi:hypothetical protein